LILRLIVSLEGSDKSGLGAEPSDNFEVVEDERTRVFQDALVHFIVALWSVKEGEVR
jgi:hypothetical protein